MTKVFNAEIGKLEKKPSKGFNNLVEEFYSRIGERFPVRWIDQNGIKVPQIDPDDLPEEVSETDIENILNEMKLERWF